MNFQILRESGNSVRGVFSWPAGAFPEQWQQAETEVASGYRSEVVWFLGKLLSYH